MNITTLVADPAAINIRHFISEPQSITVVAQAVQRRSHCPKCQHLSSSLHSHDQRTVADLPWHGVTVRIQLHTRKFRCQNELCAQKVFCERLPRVVDTYARKSVRLNAALTLLAFALGGEAGARAASGLNLHVSGDTLLRRIRRAAITEVATPKVLGVDDWAKRKGHSYGTILVDLEEHRPIDLLPDRESATLAAWLTAHRGIEVVSRDRSQAYATGINEGAPHGVQVADRFHLLMNVREVLKKFLLRQTRQLRRQTMAVKLKIKSAVETDCYEQCRLRLLPHLQLECDAPSGHSVTCSSVSPDSRWARAGNSPTRNRCSRICIASLLFSLCSSLRHGSRPTVELSRPGGQRPEGSA